MGGSASGGFRGGEGGGERMRYFRRRPCGFAGVFRLVLGGYKEERQRFGWGEGQVAR